MRRKTPNFAVCSSFVFNGSRDLTAERAVAFRLYDIDGDNMVGRDDLEQMLQLVIGEQLGEERVKTIAQRALDELDVDGDGKLSFSEFGKVRALWLVYVAVAEWLCACV